MSQRKFKFSTGEFYHVYSRGVEKRNIFEDVHDFDRFVKLLYIANGSNSFDFVASRIEDVYTHDRGDRLVDICVYTLMTNHFHLLLKEITEGGITRFMQKLLTAYSMYFNTKYERNGSLFQGKFKAKHVDNDNYLKHLPIYLHLNAMDIYFPKWKDGSAIDKQKARKMMEEYSYSSLRDYCGPERMEGKIITKEALPQYYNSVTEMLDDLKDWIDITQELNLFVK